MKQRKDRPDHENKNLASVLGEISYFRNSDINLRTLEKIAKLAQYDFRKKDKVVFRQGAVGDKLYVIIHGQVSIFVKNEKYFNSKRIEQQLKLKILEKKQVVTSFNG